MTLSAEQYATLQHQIVTLAGLVADMPLSDFLQMIHRTESVAPILDPTLYIKGAAKMGIVKDLAEALLHFQRAAKKAQGTVLERGIA